MGKLINLDKKLENIAINWYINKNYGRALETLSKGERELKILALKRSLDTKQIVKEYFYQKPNVKKQYQLQKQRLKKINTLAGLGILTLAVGTGATYKMSNKEPVKTGITIEKTKTDIKENEESASEKEFANFFEELNAISNLEKRNRKIVEFTKEKIVEAYNKKSEENITKDQLEYYHLNEFVIANKDNLGNDVSYKRTSQTVEEKLDENQEFKRLHGGIYEFKVDGKTVAVYDANGNEIEDDNIENKKDFFRKSLSLVEQASKLQDVYKYRSTSKDIEQEQDKYKSVVNGLVDLDMQAKINIEIEK